MTVPQALVKAAEAAAGTVLAAFLTVSTCGVLHSLDLLGKW